MGYRLIHSRAVFMRLADILTSHRVATGLGPVDKHSALRALSAMFEEQDTDEVFSVLLAREALASTGVGSGVAIPHARLASASKVEAALAISAPGVEFDAVDARPAHILVAVVAPEQNTGDHLKALARVSRLLRDAELREALIAASSSAEAFELLMARDAVL